MRVPQAGQELGGEADEPESLDGVAITGDDGMVGREAAIMEKMRE